MRFPSDERKRRSERVRRQKLKPRTRGVRVHSAPSKAVPARPESACPIAGSAIRRVVSCRAQTFTSSPVREGFVKFTGGIRAAGVHGLRSMLTRVAKDRSAEASHNVDAAPHIARAEREHR